MGFSEIAPPPYGGRPFIQSLNPLDIQVNLADPLDIHLKYFENPLDIQI